MMDLYYRILNSGIELPLSAGSANGVKATPVGYNRVYVRLGETGVRLRGLHARAEAGSELLAEQTGPGVGELTLEKGLRFDRSSWAAVRAFERANETEPSRPAGHVFAHTSPVYFLVAGRPVVVPDSVRDLLQKIDRLIAHMARLEGFRQESRRQETLDAYREARGVLSRRLRSATRAAGPG